MLFASVAGTAVLMCRGHIERAFCEHKKKHPTIPRRYQLFHNYIRPHEALDGKTPAETCGIKVEGENKWLTLIQNASKKKL